MISASARKTNMKCQVIEKIMKTGYDYYITADEAIKLGIVDRMVGDTKPKK